MKGKSALVGLMAVLASGCATSKTIYLPSGQQGHSISCDGSALSWSLCYEKAGKICGQKGYDIFQKDGEETPMITGSPYLITGGAIVTRTLVIACK